MDFKYTTAISRIRRMTARKKVIQGGTSAGKTLAILAVLIDIAAKKKTEISVVSESIPHLRRGAIKDFAKVMQWTNRWVADRWNKTLLTYNDNEALPDTIKRDIELNRTKAETSAYWANWWKVYGLGQVGTLQGAIYEDFEVVEGIDVSRAKFVALGLDWGFSNDPTALVAIYRQGDCLLIQELLYSTGLTNQDIADKLRSLGITRAWEIVADSAEPKSIEEIYRLGFNIKPADKGPDSVRNGIDILKRFKLQVTKDSTNLIKELRSYTWATDKEGKNTGVPIDSFNHACDAMRYVALNKLRVSNSGKYVVV